MRRAAVSAGRTWSAARSGVAARVARLTTLCIGVAASSATASLVGALAFARDARAQAAAPVSAAAAASAARGMKALADDELSNVRGADGVAFNLSNFSLTSSLTDPLTLTYKSPNGSSLALSGLDISRTDDPDGFADPYLLSMQSRSNLADVIALDFPKNTLGNQKWSLTSDFSNYDVVANSTFYGGTLQVTALTMMGGGLYVAPTAIADTQGIAFGLGTRLDIGSLAVYSHGRNASGVIDTSDSLTLTGLHLADATTGGAWMLADVTTHPGLINAFTDSTGSYLHLQLGWPTTADPVSAGSLKIDNISFATMTPGVATPTTVNLGSASIASMQINFLDIKFKGGQ